MDATLPDGVSLQLFQRRRLDVFVARRSAPTEVVLEQFLGVSEVAELTVRPGEEASRLQRVMLVAESAEQTDALLEQPPRPGKVALVVGGDPHQEQGQAGPPRIPKGPVERQPLLGP